MAENVAVVINDASPASQKIADHYIKKRGIPAANVIHLHTATTDDISRAAFGATIETPIAAAIARANLQDRILYIVLTKDVPLRVDGTSGPQGTVASVDSELSLLYRKMTGRPVTITGRVDNPYFLGPKNIAEARPFTHAEHDIFLVTPARCVHRRRGDRADRQASAPSTDGKVVLDEKNSFSTGPGGLARGGREPPARMGQNTTRRARSDDDRRARRVAGHRLLLVGSDDPANRVRKTTWAWSPALVARSSAPTRTLHEPPPTGVPSDDWNDRSKQFAGSPQSLIGDLIREGATGAAGHVAEPYLESTVHPNILFPVYLAGFNLAESYYLAIPHLSWQTVVIGDPLCRPFSGTVLAHANIEAPDDPATELPGYFSKRKLEVAQARLGFPSPEALALGVKAETRLEKGDRAGGRKAFEQAIAADPGFVTGKFLLAQLVEADGDHDAAIELYRSHPGAAEQRHRAEQPRLRSRGEQTSAPGGQTASRARRRAVSAGNRRSWIPTPGSASPDNHPDAARLIAVAVNGAPGNAEIPPARGVHLRSQAARSRRRASNSMRPPNSTHP